MKKYFLFVVIFGILVSGNISASLVAFHIVETGIPESGAAYEYTQLWENAFMDVFFDAGYIVSNAPIIRIETKPDIGIFDYIINDIAEIRRWGVDYILITQLDYTGDSRLPAQIKFIIYKVTSNETILERNIEGRTYRSAREGQDDIRSIIRGLVPYIR